MRLSQIKNDQLFLEIWEQLLSSLTKFNKQLPYRLLEEFQLQIASAQEYLRT